MKPITVEIPHDKWLSEIIDWLKEAVGYGVICDVDAWRNNDVQWSYYFYNTTDIVKHFIEFRDPELAMLFKFRYC